MKKIYFMTMGVLIFVTAFFGCGKPRSFPELGIGVAGNVDGGKVTLKNVELKKEFAIGETPLRAENGDFYVIAEVEYEYKKPFVLSYDSVQLWNYYVASIPDTTKVCEGMRQIHADRIVTEQLNGKDVFQENITKQTVRFFFISPPSLRNMRFFQFSTDNAYFYDRHEFARPPFSPFGASIDISELDCDISDLYIDPFTDS
jgi:hypothetical protein